MGSIVHRSVPTNLKWFPTCSHAHAMFQDRFKDVQVGSRWFSTLYILSPNFHKVGEFVAQEIARLAHQCPVPQDNGELCAGYQNQRLTDRSSMAARHFFRSDS